MHRPQRRLPARPGADPDAARRRARDRSLRRDAVVVALSLVLLGVAWVGSAPDREHWWFVPAMIVGIAALLSALVRMSIAVMTGGPPSAFRR